MARRQFSATPVKRYFVLLRRSSRRRIRENKRATVRRGFMTGSILEIDTIVDSLVGPFLSPSLSLSSSPWPAWALLHVYVIQTRWNADECIRTCLWTGVRGNSVTAGSVYSFTAPTRSGVTSFEVLLRGGEIGKVGEEGSRATRFAPLSFIRFVVTVWLKILSYFAKIVNNSYSLDFLDLPLFLSFFFSYPLSSLLEWLMVDQSRSDSTSHFSGWFRPSYCYSRWTTERLTRVVSS